MLARQRDPIDTSSPDEVVNPLWHAMQPCDVSKSRVAKGGCAGAACAGVALESIAKKAAIPISPIQAQGATIDRAHGVRRGSIPEGRALPPAEESTIEPVPKHVGDDLARPRSAVADRKAQTYVAEDVLSPRERELDLRNPVGRCGSTADV